MRQSLVTPASLPSLLFSLLVFLPMSIGMAFSLLVFLPTSPGMGCVSCLSHSVGGSQIDCFYATECKQPLVAISHPGSPGHTILNIPISSG